MNEKLLQPFIFHSTQALINGQSVTSIRRIWLSLLTTYEKA